MNGDPYRTPQPADRRVINRSGQPYPRTDEPQVSKEEGPVVSAALPSHGSSGRQTHEKKSSKGIIWTVIGLVVVALIVLTAWFLISQNRSGTTGVDSSKYQAVFLANGQIYFGKLQDFNGTSFRMTNIYHAQAKQEADSDTESSISDTEKGGIQLIRLGDEVYGPENEIFILKEQIIHYENLKSDSKVSQLIKQNEAK